MTDRIWCFFFGGVVAVALAFAFSVPSVLQAVADQRVPLQGAPARFAVQTRVIAGRGATIMSAGSTACELRIFSGAERNEPPLLQVGKCPELRQISWRVSR